MLTLTRKHLVSIGQNSYKVGMRFVVGADPGRKGAVVVLDAETGKIVDMIPSKMNGDELDHHYLHNRLVKYRGACESVWLENVHAIFGSSAGATFAFGDAYGALRVILALVLETPFDGNGVQTVSPKVWQKTAWKNIEIVASPKMKDGRPIVLKSGLPKMDVDTKATSLRAAQAIFPGESFILPRCRKPHDGVVDAALIAYHGWYLLNHPQPEKKPRSRRGSKSGR